MNLFVLTTVNEDYEIVSARPFDNLDLAKSCMRQQFYKEEKAFKESFSEESFIEDTIEDMNASLIVDDGEPVLYKWQIVKL